MRRLALAAAAAIAMTAHPAAADPIAYDQAKASPWLTHAARRPLVWTLEASYQALSLADAWSTCASGHLPGVEEAGAGGLLGRHPSCAADYEFALARSGLHALATWELARGHAANFWQVLLFLGTAVPEGVAVRGNVRLLHPTPRAQDCPAC